MGYKTIPAKIDKSAQVDDTSVTLDLTTEPERLSSSYSTFKNIIERPAALLLLVVLSPFLLLFSIAVRIDSPGHPIFSQERTGQNGRRFIAYKFRTMFCGNDDREYRSYIKKYILDNAPFKIDRNGEKIYKVVNDPRVTRVGALLRKTNFDELPQLINILKGEMSFIGPRPDLPFSVEMYHDWHRGRLAVKPGITGLWQICHRKGLCFDDMVKLDIEYIEQRSFLLDLKILLHTIRTVLTGDGS
jgi:lipopolysaccharide/colanic/teichoic acid biosynthesis glycosyltransferase